MEDGKVIRIEDNIAVVALEKGEECEGCKACCAISSDDSNVMIAKVQNSLEAKEGDRVKIQITPSQTVLASAIVYMLPLVLFILGFLLGSLLIARFISTDPQGTGIIFALVSLVGAFWLVKVIEKANKGFFQPKMTKKL